MNPILKLLLMVVLVLVFGLLLSSANQNEAMNLSIDNKKELGRQLFFEKGLSLDSSISCASCHIPEYAFSDTLALSIGVNGKLGLRNAPSVMNVKSRDLFFYDGRARDIEDQVHFPVQDPNEMNLAFEIAVSRIAANPVYLNAFLKLYHSVPTASNVANAIAEFENSLETSSSPYDDYMNDKVDAMSASALRGMDVFLSEKAKCFDCHFSPDFTGDEFKNIGLYDGNEWNDQGRFKISGDSADMGKFKVPGLRNVGATAPYMHNGKFKTLKEVIEYYNNPYKVVAHPLNMDSSLIKPLNLTEQEKDDLLNFLMSLTDRRFLNRG